MPPQDSVVVARKRQEAAAAGDGGDEGPDRLRGLRAPHPQGRRRHPRVTGVEVLPKQNKVAVTGYIDDPAKVMRRVARKTGKKVEPWPYVHYDVVPHPCSPGAYDKKAPPGYVRNVVADPDAAPLARASSTEVKYTSAFSDENPHAACAVM